MSFVYHDRDDHPKDYWPPAVHRTAPEAAHAASECDDEFLAVNELKERAANRIAALVSVVVVLGSVVFVALGVWK